METRANNVFVGAVTLALLAGLAAFFVWIARLNEGNQKKYDIFFKQSVNGLVNGSQVTFSGVPIGKIVKIELWPRDPSFVKVRISVDKAVPILIGTTATMQSSFTGTGEILLEDFLKPMNLSQYRLAKDIGVPPRRINEIVKNRVEKVSVDYLLGLCAKAGISVSVKLAA